MKLSVAIAGETASPEAFVVWRGFEASIRKAAEVGYQGVELALKSADEIDASRLAGWLGRWGVQVSAISTGQVFSSLGLCLTNPDREAAEKASGAILELIRVAQDFGGLVNIGRVRGGIPKGQTREDVKRLFLHALESICNFAENRTWRSCSNR